MNRTAMPSSRWSSLMRSRIWAWMVTSRAVVGSSAMRRLGSLARAIAIITRCRSPPGELVRIGARASSPARRAPPARATRGSTGRAAAAESPRWRKRVSPSCLSTVCRGLSEDMGSWKIMPISSPRTAWSSRSVMREHVPALEDDLARRIGDERFRNEPQDGLGGHRLSRPALADEGERLVRLEREVHAVDDLADLPAPPEADAEAADGEQGAAADCAHQTALRGSKASRTASPTKTRRLRVPARTTKADDPQPGRLEVVLALGEEVAERGRAEGQAEAEEVERGQGRDGAAEDEGQEGEGRHHRVGQDVAEDDPRVAQPQGPRGEDVLEVARPEELGPAPRRRGPSSRRGG